MNQGNPVFSDTGPKTIQTKTVTIEQTVAALDWGRWDAECTVTGEITTIIIQFPPGCNGLVDVACGHEQIWSIPSERDTYLALDSVTQPFYPRNEKVQRHDRLWGEIRNTDTTWPHKITIIFVLEGCTY